MYGAVILGIYIGGTTLYEKFQQKSDGEFVGNAKDSILSTLKKLFKQENPSNQGYEGMGQDGTRPGGLMDDEDNYADDDDEDNDHGHSKGV